MVDWDLNDSTHDAVPRLFELRRQHPEVAISHEDSPLPHWLAAWTDEQDRVRYVVGLELHWMLDELEIELEVP